MLKTKLSKGFLLRGYSVFLSLIILIVLCLQLYTYAEKTQITEPYDYSFTEEADWGQLSPNERDQLCQIPSDIVDKMSTEALLDSVLDCPFMIDLLAFDEYERGYLKIKNMYPALQSLINRTDISHIIVNKYCNSVKNYKNKKSGEDFMNSLYTTVLISLPQIRDKLSEEDAAAFNQALEGHYADINADIKNELANKIAK